MKCFIVCGASGTKTILNWNVKIFQNLKSAEEFKHKLNTIIKEHEDKYGTQFKDSIITDFIISLHDALSPFDKNNLVCGRLSWYYIDELEIEI